MGGANRFCGAILLKTAWKLNNLDRECGFLYYVNPPLPTELTFMRHFLENWSKSYVGAPSPEGWHPLSPVQSPIYPPLQSMSISTKTLQLQTVTLTNQQGHVLIKATFSLMKPGRGVRVMDDVCRSWPQVLRVKWWIDPVVVTTGLKCFTFIFKLY